jgi:hypothetical protein
MGNGAPGRCSRCGSDWWMDSPDYGGGASYAHYCYGSKVQRREDGGGRYIGGGRYSLGPGTDEPVPDLPDGYYAQRRLMLLDEARRTHEAGCRCMCCGVNALEDAPPATTDAERR